MKDSQFLHFLKNFPPWIVLVFLTITFVILYYLTKDVSYKEWVALALASLFTALGVRSAQPQQQGQTTYGDVNQLTPQATEKKPDSSETTETKPEEIPPIVETVNETPSNPLEDASDEEIEELIPRETEQK